MLFQIFFVFQQFTLCLKFGEDITIFGTLMVEVKTYLAKYCLARYDAQEKLFSLLDSVSAAC